MKAVEFVDYTGEFPCLCSGEVTLKIDGQVVEFCRYKSDSEKTGKPYLSLTSGGRCYFDDDVEWHDHVEYGPWSIDLDPRYAEIEDEILEVINSNIPWGCCGGCL